MIRPTSTCLLLLPFLSGCLGVVTERPICKISVLADVTGLPGPVTLARKTGDVRGVVEKIDKGIYLVREEHPLHNRNENAPHIAVRFCRIGTGIFAEFQHYNLKTKTLASRSYWPQQVVMQNQQLRLSLVDTTIEHLDTYQVPYYLFPRKKRHQANGFIVANSDIQIDKHLAMAVAPMESQPQTIIDLSRRTIFSPMLFD